MGFRSLFRVDSTRLGSAWLARSPGLAMQARAKTSQKSFRAKWRDCGASSQNQGPCFESVDIQPIVCTAKWNEWKPTALPSSLFQMQLESRTLSFSFCREIELYKFNQDRRRMDRFQKLMFASLNVSSCWTNMKDVDSTSKRNPCSCIYVLRSLPAWPTNRLESTSLSSYLGSLWLYRRSNDLIINFVFGPTLARSTSKIIIIMLIRLDFYCTKAK